MIYFFKRRKLTDLNHMVIFHMTLRGAKIYQTDLKIFKIFLNKKKNLGADSKHVVSIIFYLIYTFTHLENDKCQKETGFKYGKNPVLGSVYTNNYGCLFLKERNIGENYFYHRIVIILEKSSLPLILFLLALSVANILKIHRIKFKP